MDRSPPGSSVHDIFQARLLEWVAISSSRDLPDSRIEPVSPALAGGFFTTEPPGKLSRYIVHYIKTRDYIIVWAQMKEIDFLLSIRCRVCNRCWPFFFSRQEYWSGLPLPSPQCRRPGFNSWVEKIPGGGNGNPLQYSCLDNSTKTTGDKKEYWNFHGQKSLVGYSPRGHKKLDATEHHVLHTKFVYRTLFCKIKECIYTQE